MVGYNRNLFLFLIISFLFVFLVFTYNDVGNQYSEVDLIWILLLSFAIYLFFLLKKENVGSLKKQYFKISNLFLIGFLVVHFQFYVDIAIGFSDINSIYTINPDVVNKSSIIVAISLCAFCAGYIFKLAFSQNKIKLCEVVDTKARGIKIIIFISFFGFLLLTPLEYFKSGYSKIEISPISILLQSIFVYSVVALLIINNMKEVSGNNNLFIFIKSFGFVTVTIVVFFCILIIMSGDRGPLINIVLAITGSYIFKSRKKYSLLFFSAAIFVAAIFISLLAQVRHLDNINSPQEAIELAIERDKLSVGRESIISGTEELSRSIRTLHAAVDHTNMNGFSLGYYKIHSLLQLVPGIGRLIVPLLDIDTEAKTSALLTAHIGIDHGMGTTIVADIWVDFGMTGIIIIFFTFGWFLRYIDVLSYQQDPKSIFSNALIMSCLISSIYLGRGVLLDLFKGAIFIYLLILINWLLNKIIYSRRNLSNTHFPINDIKERSENAR